MEDAVQMAIGEQSASEGDRAEAIDWIMGRWDGVPWMQGRRLGDVLEMLGMGGEEMVGRWRRQVQQRMREKGESKK